MKYVLIALVWFYTVGIAQPLKIILGTKDVCRYDPTCSQYALMRLQQDGVKSVPDIVHRLLSCHPFGTIQK